MQDYQKKFVKFTFPAIMSMLVTTLYTFVDGIFVGNYVGANALGAINIVWPFISLCISVTTMISVGGGAMVSINFGRKNTQRAQSLFSQSVFALIFFLSIFSVICVLFPRQLSKMLGANELLLDYCATYMRYFMFFGIFFGLAYGISVFVSNDSNPILSFASMLTGAVTNIFLDWLFVGVLGFGLEGAAIASGLGQVFAFLILLIHFIFKKGELKLKIKKPIKKDIIKILKTGFPAFIADNCVPISIIIHNRIIIMFLGEKGISSFGIMCYVISVFMCVFAGVSQGVQPIISRYYGEKNFTLLNKTFRLGFKFSVILGISIYVLLTIFAKQVAGIFIKDQEIIALTSSYMIKYNLFGVFFSMTNIIIALFQATRIIKVATTISVLKCFVFNFIYILTLPFIFGAGAIWICAPLAELSTLICAYLLYKRNIGILKEA